MSDEQVLDFALAGGLRGEQAAMGGALDAALARLKRLLLVRGVVSSLLAALPSGSAACLTFCLVALRGQRLPGPVSAAAAAAALHTLLTHPPCLHSLPSGVRQLAGRGSRAAAAACAAIRWR